jgi:hypothetical protein
MSAGFFMPENDLIPSDFRTSTWKRLTKLLEERLEELREFNDASSNTETKTALMRGQISEVKRLLSLSEGSERADDFPITGEVDRHDE